VTAGAVVSLVSAGALLYGRHRLQTVVTKNGPRVAVIQGNIPQDVKNVLTIENLVEIFAGHLALTDRAQKVSEPPDLVIWPETMAPYGGLDPIEPGVLEEADIERLTERQLFQRLCVMHLTPRQRWSDLLISSVCVLGDKDHPILHNSAYLLPRGKRGAEFRYDKIHLVPFGEYVPMKGLIGWIVAPLIPYEHGVTPGAGPKLFECKGWRFAPTICYEDAFPGLVADFARGPEKMDFIVNVTNEGWFKDGIELDQHLAIAVFRAIECRAGFIRAANTGISAFINPTGQILSKLEVDGRDREVSGVLHGFATATDVRSPYLTPLPWADSWVSAILGCRTAGQLFGSLAVVVLVIVCAFCALPSIRRKLRRTER